MEQTRVGRGSWKEVAEHIRAGIREGRFVDGGKLPSEAELMRDHGASKMTVHRALRELAAEGIVDRIERIGTFVKAAAANSIRRIGLIVPTSEGFLEFKLLSGLRSGLGSTDQFVLYATDNDPVAEAEALDRVTSEVDAVVIMPICVPRNSRKMAELRERGIPVVCVDRASVFCELPAVTTNNHQVTYQALQQLAAEGHKRVAYFGMDDDKISSLHDRYQAYKEFCVETGADPYELARFIPAHSGVQHRVSLSLLEDSLFRMLSGREPITLAFCANEFFLEAVAEAAKNLPHELVNHLELVGFSDWPRLHHGDMRMHIIRQNAKGIGEAAAFLLLQILTEQEAGIPRIEVPATFIHADDPLDLPQMGRVFVDSARAARTGEVHS